MRPSTVYWLAVGSLCIVIFPLAELQRQATRARELLASEYLRSTALQREVDRLQAELERRVVRFKPKSRS